MKHALTITVEVDDEPGMMLKQEVATVDDPESPVTIIYAGFPAPLDYEFKSRQGNHYRVNLNPVIQAAIRQIGVIEAPASEGE